MTSHLATGRGAADAWKALAAVNKPGCAASCCAFGEPESVGTGVVALKSTESMEDTSFYLLP